jgi:hypothetical protein
MFLSLCFRQSHNLKVVGSNPAPATNLGLETLVSGPYFIGVFALASFSTPSDEIRRKLGSRGYKQTHPTHVF